jgi:naphthoate synthase
VRARHRQRAVAEGWRLGVLQRGRPAHPRQVGLPVLRRRRRAPAAGRGWPPAHPRGAAADPVHAQFKQTDTDVASFDGGYGSAYLARQVGQKFAREIFFLGREYSAADAHRMGMVNLVVPHAELEQVALEWGREVCRKSPTGQRMSKFAFNLIDDGLVGQQVFAGEATRLAYMTDEAQEGRDAFLQKRDPDWDDFPYYF